MLCPAVKRLVKIALVTYKVFWFIKVILSGKKRMKKIEYWDHHRINKINSYYLFLFYSEFLSIKFPKISIKTNCTSISFLYLPKLK